MLKGRIIMESKKRLRVLLDTDVGDDIDDALAIVFALNSPELEIVSVTTVFRNADKRAKIASALLESCGNRTVPVYAGCDAPLVQKIFAHEHDRYDETGRYIPCQFDDNMERFSYNRNTHAVDQIIHMAHCYPGELDVVAIGPLTNIALAIRKDPEIIRLIKGLTLMGGSYAEPCTEWNILCDPEAAEIVFTSGIPIRAIGLNVTTQCVLSREELGLFQREETSSSLLLNNMLERFLKHYEYDCSVLHDPLTVGTLIKPGFVRFEDKQVSIGRSNTDRAGQTIAHSLENTERSENIGRAACAVSVDAERYIEFFLKRIFSNTLQEG